MFFEENFKLLNEFFRLSRAVGARPDYVQGGGGNTSVKLKDGLMAIKASGYCLSDIRPDRAYAVLDYQALRKFYEDNQMIALDDVERQGSACARAHVKLIEGLEALRPSVEAGFHSLLHTFVLHTHSVYANLATCSAVCQKLAIQAFAGAEYTWGWVPYTDPGGRLTFAIRDELKRVLAMTGQEPSVILLQNHGILVHDDDPDTCLAIHADANERIARLFGISSHSFPETTVRPLAAGLYAADVPYLKEQLSKKLYSELELLQEPLYPDQIVFFRNTLFLDLPTIKQGQAVASSDTGEIILQTSEQTAKTLVETLTAVLFIRDHIRAAGYPLSTMGAAAQNFIQNWESEKYRKSLLK